MSKRATLPDHLEEIARCLESLVAMLDAGHRADNIVTLGAGGAHHAATLLSLVRVTDRMTRIIPYSANEGEDDESDPKVERP